LNPAEETAVTAPTPELAPVVIEKTVIIECIPLKQNGRLERDLTAPFAHRQYLSPQGDGCHKISETSTISGTLIIENYKLEQSILAGNRQP